MLEEALGMLIMLARHMHYVGMTTQIPQMAKICACDKLYFGYNLKTQNIGIICIVGKSAKNTKLELVPMCLCNKQTDLQALTLVGHTREDQVPELYYTSTTDYKSR